MPKTGKAGESIPSVPSGLPLAAAQEGSSSVLALLRALGLFKSTSLDFLLSF